MEQLWETVMAGKPKIENHGVTNRILENELTFIENRHLEEYFLMAHELVSELKKNRSFLIGPGWDWMLKSHSVKTKTRRFLPMLSSLSPRHLMEVCVLLKGWRTH